IGTMNIPKNSRGRKLSSSGYFNRSCELCTQSPIHDIKMMHSPTSNHPGSELFATQPSGTPITVLWMHSFLCIVHFRSGSKPHIIIEVLRHGHFYLGRPDVHRICREPHIYGMHLTYSAIAYKFAGALELR